MPINTYYSQNTLKMGQNIGSCFVGNPPTSSSLPTSNDPTLPMDEDPFSLGGQRCSIGAVVANVPVPVVDVVDDAVDDADDVTVTGIAVDTGAGAGAVDVVAVAAVDVIDAVDAVDVIDTGAGAGAGADLPLKDKQRLLIAEMRRTPPTDSALIEVMKCIDNPKRKPDVRVLLPLYTRISDHVLRCIIADIFHRRRMEEQLDVLPCDYTPPPLQVRNKDKGLKSSGKKGKETVNCDICGNRRAGCCQCCPDCCNRHRNCTCGHALRL
jgi:hypothetical protein